MGDALDSLRLLCTTDAVRGNNLLGKIETYNKDRQKQVIDHLKLAEEMAESQSSSKILFIASEKFEEGTVGLLAAKLTENTTDQHWSNYKNELLKARRVLLRGYILPIFFLENSKLLLTYGGHERAGASRCL